MIRRKTTMFLILHDMFRIHHPSSVARSKLKSLEHIYVYTFDKRKKNRKTFDEMKRLDLA